MIDRDEIVRALVGSWRLLLGDARGMAAFDVSIEGFWRSFAVIFLALPMPLVELAAQPLLPLGDRLDPQAMNGPLYWIGGLLAYGLSLIAFPVVLALLSGPLGVSRAYVPYMVARNWTIIPATIPRFLVTLLFLLGGLSPAALAPLNLAALGFALYYSWQVTRIACAAPPGLAGGLVALDFLLTLVVYTAADRLIGP